MVRSSGRTRSRTRTKDVVLWRRLTNTDFNAMNGLAAPYGRGGGAMHIALGVESDDFPIRRFLQTRKTEFTIATQGWPGHHKKAQLTFSGNPDRRGGEWRITDQYSHRHPAWTSDAGFPGNYDSGDPPYVLVFRSQDQFHARLTSASELLSLKSDAPRRSRSDRKGIGEVTPGLAQHFNVPGKSSLDYFEEQRAEEPEAFEPSDIEDARKKTFGAILRRQGQRKFRRRLLRAYRNTCAITGCSTLWVLEAAHITPYRGTKTNALGNGLILRADVHTLFDLGLISVHPSELEVKVSRMVSEAEYSCLDGRLLAVPKTRSAQPSRAALQDHYRRFRG